MRAWLAGIGMGVSAAVGVGVGIAVDRRADPEPRDECADVDADADRLRSDADTAIAAWQQEQERYSRSLASGDPTTGSGGVVRAEQHARDQTRLYYRLVVQSPDCFAPATVATAAQYLEGG